MDAFAPRLEVVAEDGCYYVRDIDAGTNYGKYGSRAEAEENKTSWEEYYRS